MLVVKPKSSVMMPVVKNDQMFYNSNTSTSNYLDDLILSESHNSNLFDINNTVDNLAMDDMDELEDLDDIDDLDDDDDEDSDDSTGAGDTDDDACSSTSCSSLNNSSTASPSSLTTTNTNGSYSSCSTPSKGKHGKKALSGAANTAANASTGKKYKKNQSGNVKQARSSRFNSMGYSSDNPAEKRAFHILSERQRRNDLKKLFETLRVNIPTLGDKQKASKLTILKAAVDHLCEVGNRRERLHSHYEKEKLRNTQLLQHLKSLQNEVSAANNSQQMSAYAPGFSLTNSTHCQSQMATLAVH
jgi:hypothetical protein